MKMRSPNPAHKAPKNLLNALAKAPKSKAAWQDITPLARNEWICWIASPKKEETRKEHLERAVRQLGEGKRRPCCWPGCPHR